MDFEQRLTEEIGKAMRAGDKSRLRGLRALKSEILNERTKTGQTVGEELAVKAIAAYRKKMQKSLEQFEQAGRDDLARDTASEIALCEEFLPQQVTGDELAELVERKIAEVGASSPGDIGKVMGPLMKELAGRADGSEVKKLVMERLGG